MRQSCALMESSLFETCSDNHARRFCDFSTGALVSGILWMWLHFSAVGKPAVRTMEWFAVSPILAAICSCVS